MSLFNLLPSSEHSHNRPQNEGLTKREAPLVRQFEAEVDGVVANLYPHVVRMPLPVSLEVGPAPERPIEQQYGAAAAAIALQSQPASPDTAPAAAPAVEPADAPSLYHQPASGPENDPDMARLARESIDYAHNNPLLGEDYAQEAA